MSIPGFTAGTAAITGSGYPTPDRGAVAPAGTVTPAQGLDEICGSCINGRQFCRFFTTRTRCYNVPSQGGLGFELKCHTYKVALFKGYVPCFDGSDPSDLVATT